MAPKPAAGSSPIPTTASIPVIFLTAKSQEAEIQRGLSLGAAGYVTKPFDALTLGQHVKDIVSKSQSVKIRTRAYHRPVAGHLAGRGHDRVHPRRRSTFASGMDAERQRISEVLNVHGSLWRALVELKHDQHDLVVMDLPSIRERLQRRAERRQRLPGAPGNAGSPSRTARAPAANQTRQFDKMVDAGGIRCRRSVRLARGAPLAQRD